MPPSRSSWISSRHRRAHRTLPPHTSHLIRLIAHGLSVPQTALPNDESAKPILRFCALEAKTTGVVVIETPKQGVTPQQIMAVIPEEIRATVKLYLDGRIREWYSRGDGKGVIFLVDAKTEDEARALMEALPLAKEHLMDHEYIPVGPLMPLKALMGPGAQQ